MIVAYLLIALFVVIDVWLAICMIEYLYCVFIKHQPPFVPANKHMRRAVVAEINAHYGAAKNIAEIGSGYGGLARYVARRTGGRVVAIENMPICAGVSKFFDVFCFGRCRTVWADAFCWLKNAPHIDVAVAYMGPKITPRLVGFSDKFDVLISLGFEIPNMHPVRTIYVCPGNTVYGGKKYPHRLYVYEFKNKRRKNDKNNFNCCHCRDCHCGGGIHIARSRMG